VALAEPLSGGATPLGATEPLSGGATPLAATEPLSGGATSLAATEPLSGGERAMPPLGVSPTPVTFSDAARAPEPVHAASAERPLPPPGYAPVPIAEVESTEKMLGPPKMDPIPPPARSMRPFAAPRSPGPVADLELVPVIPEMAFATSDGHADTSDRPADTSDPPAVAADRPLAAAGRPAASADRPAASSDRSPSGKRSRRPASQPPLPQAASRPAVPAAPPLAASAPAAPPPAASAPAAPTGAAVPPAASVPTAPPMAAAAPPAPERTFRKTEPMPALLPLSEQATGKLRPSGASPTPFDELPTLPTVVSHPPPPGPGKNGSAIHTGPAPVPQGMPAPMPVPLPLRMPVIEERVPGSPFMLPANPFGTLSDDTLRHFVECMIYEETQPVQIPPELREARKPTDDPPAARIPWGLLIAFLLVGVGLGVLVTQLLQR